MDLAAMGEFAKTVGVVGVIAVLVIWQVGGKIDAMRTDINALIIVLAEKNGVSYKELEDAREKARMQLRKR